MGADIIMANPATITGSIGVITGKLVVRVLKERLGVGSDTLRTNANADAWSMETPFTAEQQAHREVEADLFYRDFVERVAQGRDMAAAEVDAVARGRIWTGADAHQHGLVDELGGFRAAVRRAKLLAGLGEDTEVRIVNYPSASLWDRVRSHTSSQPAAAVGELLTRSAVGIIEHLEQTLSGANVRWLGQSRF